MDYLDDLSNSTSEDRLSVSEEIQDTSKDITEKEEVQKENFVMLVGKRTKKSKKSQIDIVREKLLKEQEAVKKFGVVEKKEL